MIIEERDMYRTRLISAIFAIFLAIPSFCLAQTSGVGSINGGLAKGGAGSTALVTKLGTLVDRGVFNRVANRSKKTTSSKRSNSKNTKPGKTTANSNDPVKLADASVLKFRPGGNSGVDRSLAGLLSEEAEVQQGLLLIFSETKKAYDSEAAKLGRKNDLAFAMTFFITTAVTVHNDAPEPSDAATENLYKTLAESMRESENIAQMSDRDKELASDALVYVSGLILAGYITSKDSGDDETLGIYRQAAADTLLALTGISADRMLFTEDGLDFTP